MDKIAYIIPLCHRKLRSNPYGEETNNRLEGINNCLYDFIMKQTNIEIEIIFIEQILDEQEYYLPYIRSFEFDNVNVIKLRVSHLVFNKCWLYNIAAYNATTDHLLFAEGDVFSKHDCLYDLVRFVKNTKSKWCFGWDRIYYTTEKERNLLVENKEFDINKKDYKKPGKGKREGGLVYINRNIFNKIGGYNEWIEELGGPDNDIAHRLHEYTRQYRKFLNTIIHLWHPRDVDKYKATRKWNVKVMKKTFRYADDVIKFLVSKQKGQIKYPLCDSEPFIGLFNRKKHYRDVEITEELIKKIEGQLTKEPLTEEEELIKRRLMEKQIIRPRKNKKAIRKFLIAEKKIRQEFRLQKIQEDKETLDIRQKRQWKEIKRKRERLK